MALSKTTRDHDEIRRWAEERGGRAAVVTSTEGDDQTGIIRLEFPGAPNLIEDLRRPRARRRIHRGPQVRIEEILAAEFTCSQILKGLAATRCRPFPLRDRSASHPL
ncbi:MAG TPA: hypothetical protein VGU25_07695 [Acidobacteriaceae bacterium]|nr:hypothetical protein [Acidobacteriaceae bacterium]